MVPSFFWFCLSFVSYNEIACGSLASREHKFYNSRGFFEFVIIEINFFCLNCLQSAYEKHNTIIDIEAD